MTRAPKLSEPDRKTRSDKRIAGIERYDTADANLLYQRVWGRSFHFGLWEKDVSSISSAALRCKQRIGMAMNIGTEHRVLETGSGLGETSRYLARTFGCHVMATNISEEHHKECLALTEQAGMTEDVVCSYADYHNLPFEKACFDAYVVQEALVHATNKQQVMKEAYRVLRPGGRLVYTDQTTAPERLSKAECDRIAERHGSPDLYDKAAFIRATKQAGFIILESLDWTDHMARHFAELARFIEENYNDLEKDISPTVIDWNLETWRFARDKAYEGSMGWIFVSAQRPE